MRPRHPRFARQSASVNEAHRCRVFTRHGAAPEPAGASRYTQFKCTLIHASRVVSPPFRPTSPHPIRAPRGPHPSHIPSSESSARRGRDTARETAGVSGRTGDVKGRPPACRPAGLIARVAGVGPGRAGPGPAGRVRPCGAETARESAVGLRRIVRRTSGWRACLAGGGAGAQEPGHAAGDGPAA